MEMETEKMGSRRRRTLRSPNAKPEVKVIKHFAPTTQPLNRIYSDAALPYLHISDDDEEVCDKKDDELNKAKTSNGAISFKVSKNQNKDKFKGSRTTTTTKDIFIQTDTKRFKQITVSCKYKMRNTATNAKSTQTVPAKIKKVKVENPITTNSYVEDLKREISRSDEYIQKTANELKNEIWLFQNTRNNLQRTKPYAYSADMCKNLRNDTNWPSKPVTILNEVNYDVDLDNSSPTLVPESPQLNFVDQPQSLEKEDVLIDVRTPSPASTIHSPKATTSTRSNLSPLHHHESSQVHLTMSKGLPLGKDDYFTLFNEQNEHIKQFSNLVMKAQRLVKHISTDLKVCSGGQSVKPNFNKIVEVFNVSTQMDLSDSKEELVSKPGSSEKGKIKKEKKLHTNEDVDQLIHSASLEGSESSVLIACTETYGINNFETKSNEIQVDEATFEESGKGVEARTSGSNAPDEIQRKLSKHLLPPVTIKRELATQKIPCVIIHPEESIPQTDNHQNVAYEIVSSTTNKEIVTNNDKPNLVDTSEGGILENVSLSNIHGSSEQLNKNDRNIINTPSTEDIVLKEKPMNVQVLKDTVAQKIANTCKYLTKSQKDDTSDKIKEDILRDPNAYSMYQSYQIIEKNRVPSCDEKIDEDRLTFIDDDVYKTYVNPDGFKNSNYSDKPSKSSTLKDCSVETFYKNKTTQADGNSSNEEYIRVSREERHSSIISYKCDNNLTQPLTNLLPETSSDLKLYCVNQKDRSEYADMYNLVPEDLRKQPKLKSLKQHKKKSGENVNNSVLPNFHHGSDEIPSQLNRNSINHYRIGSLFESNNATRNRESEAGNSSQNTEDIILSIDNFALRKKESNNVVCSINGPIRAESTSTKVCNDSKKESKKLSTYEERDVRVNTSSSMVDSDTRKSLHITGDSIKTINLFERDPSVNEEIHCCGCARFCFSKFKRGNAVSAKNQLKVMPRKSSLNERKDKRPFDGSVSNSDTQQKRNVTIEEPFFDSVRLQERDSTVESFIRELTRGQSSIASNHPLNETIANPSTLNANYSNTEVLNFIKKASDGLVDNKRKYTVLPMNIQQPTFITANCECKKDKVFSKHVYNEYTHFERSLDYQPEISLTNNDGYTSTNDGKNLTILDYETPSEGEIKGDFDCSIGEVHSRSPGESVFMREMQKSNRRILSKKTRNSNWITYYISSDSTTSLVDNNS